MTLSRMGISARRNRPRHRNAGRSGSGAWIRNSKRPNVICLKMPATTIGSCDPSEPAAGVKMLLWQHCLVFRSWRISFDQMFFYCNENRMTIASSSESIPRSFCWAIVCAHLKVISSRDSPEKAFFKSPSIVRLLVWSLTALLCLPRPMKTGIHSGCTILECLTMLQLLQVLWLTLLQD